jgi:hypothetical protein
MGVLQPQLQFLRHGIVRLNHLTTVTQNQILPERAILAHFVGGYAEEYSKE